MRFTRIPVEKKVNADSVVTTTPMAFIVTRYCLFSMFYQFIQMIENLFGKMIEGALISKSQIITLNIFVNLHVSFELPLHKY